MFCFNQPLDQATEIFDLILRFNNKPTESTPSLSVPKKLKQVGAKHASKLQSKLDLKKAEIDNPYRKYRIQTTLRPIGVEQPT